MHSIETLTAFVSPPADAVQSTEGPLWKKNAEWLGLNLPTEYLDIARTYGEGWFGGGYLQVFHPFGKYYLKRLKNCLYAIEDEDLQHAGATLQAFPATPGLLPWGADEGGNKYFWYTDQSWPIVVHERFEAPLHVYEINICEFLMRLLRNDLWEDWEYPPPAFAESEWKFTPFGQR